VDNPIRLNETQLSWLSLQLEEGETIGWAAVEKRWRYLKRFAGPIFFILIWTGIPTLILSVMLREMLNPAKQSAGLIAVVLFPAAFIAIGGFLLYRMALIIFQGGPAIYAITDRRALILEPGVPGRMHAFTPAQLRRLEKHVRSDSSGDILFTQAPPISGAMSEPIQPGFLDIPGVEQAWGLLEQLAKTAPEPAESAALPAAAPDLQAVLKFVGKAYPKWARFLASGGSRPGTNITPLALAPFQGVSDEQLAQVRAAITPGEGLRWAGQPDPWQFALGRLAARGVVSGRGAATAPLRLASIGFGLIVIGIFMASACPGVLLLVIPGVFLIAATPLSEFWRARRTLYAVTDRRALTFEGSKAECIRAVNIEALPADFKAGAPFRHDIPEVEFYGLPDVDGVRRLMASIAVASRPSGI